MIPPLLLTLHVERGGGGRRFRLWLPLFLFWLLILPFALVTLPIVVVVLAGLDYRPLRLFAAYWNLLCAIPGSHIEVNGRRGLVFLHVY